MWQSIKFKIPETGAAKTAQQLQLFTALAQNPSQIPKTQTQRVAHNHL